ncbi:phosphoserine phosphatase [Planococcus glaciei]|uniref:SpoIIE family protein phosphatase n=1 Tax=Planococcus glaciei TaxID=459472 RepID=A0A1G7ZES6_9BACL|nr:PP2C family serine/threonine-protein phosphatase [Planococcus glaciei]ETP68412.1 phosphoserine phosphatase [Planococcus glaciei CHR43]KOF10767.1 phosphoserine phosphatase [Planococcus glaciei]MBX0316579.1 SpoIIE family protein phosphatase [Planococcus glaciei]QDY45669.1 SpoIIE family protein phosphatase [Planococcus glaciei]QKX50869.1 SpoIIE family protein phosphatase [Planococcus glaciei]
MEKIQHSFVDAFIFNEAKKGNYESGDSYHTVLTDDYFICSIADGLGNGPVARESSQVIPKILEEFHHETIDELMKRFNDLMVQKRGAAVAIFKVDFKKKTLEYSCVGNIRFYLYRKGTDEMIYPLPVMGYLSGRPQKLRTQLYTYVEDDLFLIHSDGVELRNPKAMMRQAGIPERLYYDILRSIQTGDDATFIAGSLLK